MGAPYVISEVESTPFSNDRDNVVGADLFKSGITGASAAYYLAIDLSNGSGNYKHTVTSGGVILFGLTGSFIKTNLASVWDIDIGIIRTINGTQANIAWLEIGSIHSKDSSRAEWDLNYWFFPVKINLTVSGGVLTKIVTGNTENITAVNTAITLSDASNTNATPAVGDVVVRVNRASGSGTADLHLSFWYLTE